MVFASIRFLLVATSLIVSFSLCAESLKVHGFVAQGLAQAKNSNFVDDDGSVSLKLTEIGINASYKINTSLRLAGQAIYLNGGNRYPEGARIDYLFLDWQLVNKENWNIKAQIGRNKNYHWLYSSTRDVPHTRPSIVLPQSIYFDAFRDVALGVDGLAVLAQTDNTLGEWDINLSVGKSHISEQEIKNLLGDAVTGKLKHDSDKQFSVYWRPDLSQWQWGVSILDADFKYLQGPADTLYDGDETSQRIMLNFLYQGQSWEFGAELMRERVIVENLLFPGYSSDVVAEGGFFQGRYFLSNDITLLGRLDLYDRDRKDRQGKELDFASAGAVPAYFGYMDTVTLGASWDTSSNTRIQAEFHRVKGASRLAPIFAPDVMVNDQQYWNMWALQFMYWF